jgi:hypothetical protein
MLSMDNQVKDNLGDKISEITAAMMAKSSWDGECKVLFEKLEKELSVRKYTEFIGDCRYYHLTRKGQACLYDIPSNQRGFLKRYRNKRVRLICMGGHNAYTDRFYFASNVLKIISSHSSSSNTE